MIFRGRNRFINAAAQKGIEISDDYSVTVIMQQDWWCTCFILFCGQRRGAKTTAVIIALSALMFQNAHWPRWRQQTKASVQKAMKTNSMRSHQRSSDKGSALGGTLSSASKTNTLRFSCTAFSVIRHWGPPTEGIMSGSSVDCECKAHNDNVIIIEMKL